MLKQLNGPEAARYAEMTFPRYRGLLEERETIVLGIEDDERIAGLLVGKSTGAGATLLSVYVQPEQRRRGFAGELLKAFEEEAKNRGATKLESVFMTGTPSEPILRRLFHSTEWGEPKLRMLVCEGGVGKFLELPWTKRPLPPGWELVLWGELTEDERRSACAEKWIPEVLVPSRYVYEPCNSLAAYYKGAFGGFLITERTGPDRISYSTFYIRPDLQWRGCYAQLFAEGVRRQNIAMGPEAIGTGTVEYDLPGMIRFVRRRLQPCLHRVASTVGVEKRLG